MDFDFSDDQMSLRDAVATRASTSPSSLVTLVTLVTRPDSERTNAPPT